MKKIYSSLMATCLLATSFLTVGCIDETEPNSMATSEQLAANATATEALLWAMPAYMSTFDVLGYDDDAFHYDYGMGSMMQIRDVMGEEYVATAHTYEWYDSWVNNYYLGRDYVSQALVWQTFYKSILTTNQLIKAVNPETASSVQLSYLAAGKAFRAALYLDLARMYEFLPNDGTDRINADGQDVFGLTVPFVFENTTEAEARNNPRAFHTDAFNYIKKDLEEALELYDENGGLKDKQLPGFAATQGLLARAYMWHGSFLKEFGAEYDENLSANDCFEQAAYYAGQAEAGGTPMTEAQWTDPKTGFNTINKAWLWGFTTSKENDAVQTGIINWVSWTSNETAYGYASHGPYRKVAPNFYDRIPTSDFRKLSWKAPENSTLYSKLQYCDEDVFKGLPTYASLKIRPGQGNVSDYNVGSAVSVPLMRVEEMWFIEAEAMAQSGDIDGAIGVLTTFMKTYRNPKYSFPGGDIIDEIFFQKRVELWGEGLNYFDYKRLNKPVTRGYEGTPFGPDAQMNTTTRPAWMNFVIHINEINNNDAIRAFNNPNPSDCYEKTDF